MNEMLLAQYAEVLIGQLTFNLFVGGIVAWFFGRKRVIGFGWSLYFSSLNFLFGLIITLLSLKYREDNQNPSTPRKVIGWLLLLFGLVGLWGVLNTISAGGGIESLATSVAFVPALIGGGIYLIKRGSGTSFHSRKYEIQQDDF